jgi:hypothetical protein
VRRARAPGLLAIALALAAPAARALPLAPLPTQDSAPLNYPSRAAVEPGLARVGARVLYRGRVVVYRGSAFRWLAPAGGGAFEWGSPQSRRSSAFSGSSVRKTDAWGMDTMQVEIPLQAFQPGVLTVPGLGFEAEYPPGPRRTGHLPTVRLAVMSVVGPEDTSASLRPLRGPLGAPWWERLPWRIVALVALGLAVAGVAVWRLTRRRSLVTEPARARPAKDPAVVALEGLEALRGLRLPEHGRFAEHAFHLTSILRRFLEATQGAPRPGDSTPELLVRLGATRLAPAERERVGELLAAWDRVKFARAASSPEEARRAEDAVEDLARRRLAGAGGEGA